MLYERIGAGYGRFRRADPRVTGALVQGLALAAGRTIVDVGSGTGNYARALAGSGYRVSAVEPSRAMLEQAPACPGVAYVQATAEALPLADGAVDAAVCVIAITHFADPDRALAEMDRVTGSGRIAVLAIDPREAEPFWFADYFPEVAEYNLSRAERLPVLAGRLERVLGRPVSVTVVPVPDDFCDLFAGAAWSRPELCLDAGFRDRSSSFAALAPAVIESRVCRLQADIEDGTFEVRYASVRQRRSLDVGLRLLSAGPGPERRAAG